MVEAKTMRFEPICPTAATPVRKGIMEVPTAPLLGLLGSSDSHSEAVSTAELTTGFVACVLIVTVGSDGAANESSCVFCRLA